MKPITRNGNRPRVMTRGRLLFAGLMMVLTQMAWAAPFIPGNDSQVLADLPAGTRHASTPARDLSRSRIDVAIPLAQFYITRARATGDLRFLGYAENALDPWMKKTPVNPAALVLHATILQSRHDFNGSLSELNHALQMQPDNAQAWLTRATVLRVLGRYDEALQSCPHLASKADTALATLCEQSLQALTGHLKSSYETVQNLRLQTATPELRAWRYSELGEMAANLGKDEEAERWFREGLQVAPDDFYMRAALADLFLRHNRANDTLELLAGYETMEPMLLRIALAHEALNDAQGAQARSLLSNAFEVEEQRGESVHRREQARYLLDVEHQPAAALAAAQEDWKTQREPADILILMRCAQAAHHPDAAAPALKFVQQQHLEDVQLDPVKAALR
jgi:tetratricopeptide (TPR) repeat protein